MGGGGRDSRGIRCDLGLHDHDRCDRLDHDRLDHDRLGRLDHDRLGRLVRAPGGDVRVLRGDEPPGRRGPVLEHVPGRQDGVQRRGSRGVEGLRYLRDLDGVQSLHPPGHALDQRQVDGDHRAAGRHHRLQGGAVEATVVGRHLPGIGGSGRSVRSGGRGRRGGRGEQERRGHRQTAARAHEQPGGQAGLSGDRSLHGVTTACEGAPCQPAAASARRDIRADGLREWSAHVWRNGRDVA